MSTVKYSKITIFPAFPVKQICNSISHKARFLKTVSSTEVNNLFTLTPVAIQYLTLSILVIFDKGVGSSKYILTGAVIFFQLNYTCILVIV